MKNSNKHIGSDFDDFLSGEGILKEAEATAIKRVVAFQLTKALKDCHLSKATIARRMHTSRSAVERLFDPKNGSVTLLTLNKAAAAVGKRLQVQLV